MRIGLTAILMFLVPVILSGQETGTIHGRVTDVSGKAIFLANVAVPGTAYGTVTDEEGNYEISIPAGDSISLVYSCMGFQQETVSLKLRPMERKEIRKQLKISYQNLDEVAIREQNDRASTITRIDIKTLGAIPNASGNLETILMTLPGVTSRSELSSQYSVRGGNFDENLVYVNDIEVYRPFLIRSGQQEGLSFVNSDMVSSIKFSAGGFDAMYGDKMSSVLDVTYRRPTGFGGNASVSLLGGSLQLEGLSKNNRFTHTSGIRYKTSQYLLRSLETKGEYIPNFFDFQTFMTYQLTGNLEISLLGNIANNSYSFVPESRSTDFGTFQNPLNLKIYYDGRENDRFKTYTGAFTLHLKPNDDLSLKLIASAFRSLEEEKFDIQGQYLINELDNRINSATYGDSILNIGIGTFLNHARNNLDARVYSLSHLGTEISGRNILKWGLKWQLEDIRDKLREWEMIDSAGYSLPYDDSEVRLAFVSRSDNKLYSNRYTGFIQNTYSFDRNRIRYFFSAGLRAAFWDMNNQFLLSPRFTFSIKPSWKRDMIFRISSGYYYQPPFYKELRYPEGELNRSVRAQRSIHLVLGGDYIFEAWDRPFKFTTELYYKQMSDLIPYKLDNVRIQYAAENIARGYAAGIEMKIHGEFVKDAESWASISLMKTQEDIAGDYYFDKDGNRVEPGYYPRPSDQRLNFGLFFRDYLPNNPSYKVHLNLLYGTGLPFSPPDYERYDLVFRMPAYKRVDIGFSKALKTEEMMLKDGNPFRYFKNIWISAEIFNLLGVNNVISYMWLKTVPNQDNLPGMFAVPNYLTGRRFNLRLSMKF